LPGLSISQEGKLAMNAKEIKDRIKAHVQDHKEAYIAGGAFFAVGLGAGVAVGGPQLIQIVDAFSIKYKSPTTTQLINMLVRRGHPGNVIVCRETGQPFASQNQAAQMMGLNASHLAQHLQGKAPHVKGNTFERIGEATA
jgi:hypothetical protein